MSVAEGEERGWRNNNFGRNRGERELEIIRMYFILVVHEYIITSCPLDVKVNEAPSFTKRMIERAKTLM